jgi:hypothetical protein
MPINENAEKANPTPAPTRTEYREKLQRAYESGAEWQAPRLDQPGGPPPPAKPKPIPQD